MQLVGGDRARLRLSLDYELTVLQGLLFVPAKNGQKEAPSRLGWPMICLTEQNHSELKVSGGLFYKRSNQGAIHPDLLHRSL